jgi:hypothetical protein
MTCLSPNAFTADASLFGSSASGLRGFLLCFTEQKLQFLVQCGPMRVKVALPITEHLEKLRQVSQDVLRLCFLIISFVTLIMLSLLECAGRRGIMAIAPDWEE